MAVCASEKVDVCGKCEEDCVLGSDGSFRCICRDGRRLKADGYSCEPAGETNESQECKTTCNATQTLDIDVAGKKGSIHVQEILLDKAIKEIPCSRYNGAYRGNIVVQCFRGTLVADTSKCQPACILGPWEQVGVCSVTCGIGQVEHRRKVLQRPGEGQPKCGKLSKFVPCWQPACPIDCKVGEWFDSTECSKTCGEGSKIQRRKKIQSNQYGGRKCPELVRQVPCCEEGCGKKPCVVGPWKNVTDCSSLCGHGYLKQKRNVSSVDGKPCTDLTERTVPCKGDCPRVDCEEGLWEDVGECSVTCGTGKQLQRRVIVKQPENGGRVCGSLKRHVQCEMRECPIVQCAKVHAQAECTGSPFTSGLGDVGSPSDTSNCRLMDGGEYKDVATMIRACSGRCDEMRGCKAYNWFEDKRECCFLKSRTGIIDREGASCYELIDVDDDEPDSCRRPGVSRTSSRGSFGYSKSDAYDYDYDDYDSDFEPDSYREYRRQKASNNGGNYATRIFVLFFLVVATVVCSW